MEIKTKHIPGARVWVMKDNQPFEMEVKEINVNVKENYNRDSFDIDVKYKVSDSYRVLTLDESQCFATKEELRKHLFDE